MEIIRDIWVCQDCYLLANTGDATFLDYGLSEKAADARLSEIESALETLHDLVDDSTEEYQRLCAECGYGHSAENFPMVVVDEGTDDEETFHQCPSCKSLDTNMRDRGYDEFSWSSCDCCGSTLGGSRHRMAQLVYEEVAP